MKRIFSRYLLNFVFIFSIFSGICIFLLNTNIGLNICFFVVSRIIPGELTIKRLHGKLLDSIYIENLHYKYGNKTELIVGKIQILYNMYDILIKKFNLNAFYIKDIKIISNASSNDFISFEKVLNFLNKINLPLQIKCNNLKIINITLILNDKISIDHLNIFAKLHVDHKYIRYLKFNMYAPCIVMNLFGSLEDNWKIDWNFYSKFESNILDSLNFKGSVYGTRDTPVISNIVEVNNFHQGEISCKYCKFIMKVDFLNKDQSYFRMHIHNFKTKYIMLNRLDFLGKIFCPLSNKIINRFYCKVCPTTVHVFIDNKIIKLKLNFISIKGLLTEYGLFTNNIIAFNKMNFINFNFNLPKFKKFDNFYHSQIIDGKLDWNVNDIKFLKNIYPRISFLNGKLNLKCTLTGLLFKPLIKTEITCNDLSIYNSTFFNIVLKDIKLIAININDEIVYQGYAKSGMGFINLYGFINFKNDKLFGSIFIKGNDLLMVNNHETKIVISPDLLIQFKDGIYKIIGKLLVPKCYLDSLSYLSQFNFIPNEIIYLNEKSDCKFLSSNLYTNIQLELGEDVYFNIMGVSGNLKGKLQIIDNPQKNTAIFGLLFINNGNYEIYGQKFKITKGNFNFLGKGIKNLKFDIEAVRNIDKMGELFVFPNYNRNNLKQVGIRINGKIDAAKIDLFSEPHGLSNMDITSYLMFGCSITKTSYIDNTHLFLQIASKIKFNQVNKIVDVVDALKKVFGLSYFKLFNIHHDEIEKYFVSKKEYISKIEKVKSPDTLIVFGGYLTPDIYMGYNFGLLDSINSLITRYYFNKNWLIQTEYGNVKNSIDLLYSISHK